MYSDPLRLYMGGYYPPAELADATLSDPTGDNDHDGVPNGVEAFFSTDPSVFSPGLIAGIVDAGSGAFAFKHPASRRSPLPFDAAYRWSSDLASFHAGVETSEGTTVTFSVQNETPAAGQTTVTAEITGTPLDRLFVDVKVTQP